MTSGNLVRDIKTGRRALLEAFAVIEDDEDESKADAAFDAETKKSRFGPGGDAAIRHANAVRKAAANAKDAGAGLINKIKDHPLFRGGQEIAQSAKDAINKGSEFGGGSGNVFKKGKAGGGSTNMAVAFKKLKPEKMAEVLQGLDNDLQGEKLNDVVKKCRTVRNDQLEDRLNELIRKNKEDDIKTLCAELAKTNKELASMILSKKSKSDWDNFGEKATAKIDAALNEMLKERRLNETASAGASCAGGIAASFSSGGSGAFGPGFAQTKGERDDVLRRVAPGPERKTRKGNNGRKAGKIDYGV